MYKSTFILSTGRCGTQWLHKLFSEYYSDSFHAEHEPLDYEVYKTLAKDQGFELNGTGKSSQLIRHISFIRHSLKTKNYIETGPPCWSALPTLHNILPGGIKVIWVTREPRASVESLLTHGLYQEPYLPHQTLRAPVTPFDDIAQFQRFHTMEIHVASTEVALLLVRN